MVSARKAMPLVEPTRGAQALRISRRPGSVAIRVVLVDRTGRRVARRAGRGIAQASSAWQGGGGRRSGLKKRVSFDEAARGRGPGGPPLGGESNPVKPSVGIATEGVRGSSVTAPLADNAGEMERRAEGSRSRSFRAARAEIPGEPGDDRASIAEARGSPSSEARLDHAPAKVSTGWVVWKPSSRRKPRGAVIRGLDGPWSARVESRLQTLGRRIFSGG
jgi:hypothetical protein